MIKLLQEMRKEMKNGFADVHARFEEVNTRIDGLTHSVTLLAANMGGHESRIIDLELAMAELRDHHET
ncbi:MAG: hypothetical protein QGI08_07460 [Paracoccaceae bacterium]|nr:hypothetical protein [Paracoccaceae bacterium]